MGSITAIGQLDYTANSWLSHPAATVLRTRLGTIFLTPYQRLRIYLWNASFKINLAFDSGRTVYEKSVSWLSAAVGMIQERLRDSVIQRWAAIVQNHIYNISSKGFIQCSLTRPPNSSHKASNDMTRRTFSTIRWVGSKGSASLDDALRSRVAIRKQRSGPSHHHRGSGQCLPELGTLTKIKIGLQIITRRHPTIASSPSRSCPVVLDSEF